MHQKTKNPHTKILIVDDDVDDLFLVREFLNEKFSDKTIEIMEAHSYMEAQDLMETSSVDCCVFDFNLGARSGLNLLVELRESGIETPVIFLSSEQNPRKILATRAAGAVDYLPKTDRGFISLHEKILEVLDNENSNINVFDKLAAYLETARNSHVLVTSFLIATSRETEKSDPEIEKVIEDSFNPTAKQYYLGNGLYIVFIKNFNSVISKPRLDTNLKLLKAKAEEGFCVKYGYQTFGSLMGLALGEVLDMTLAKLESKLRNPFMDRNTI